MSSSEGYWDRMIDPLLARTMGTFPAVMLTGPRATGKTTTALQHAASVVRLDRPGDAAAFQADPDAALRSFAEPVLLDEWQIVPDVLGAVKRAVDSDSRPGRFLITGSAYADLQGQTWPGTGRVIRIAMYPFTVAERLGRATRPLFDRLDDGEDLKAAPDSPDLSGYVDLALQGGFPGGVLGLTFPTTLPVGFTAAESEPDQSDGSLWLQSYLEQLFTRDPETVGPSRDPVRLRKYFESYALNSAGIVSDKTIYDAAGINHGTADAYKRLLQNLVIVEELPAWWSKRLKRLTKMPKRSLVDSALMAAALQLDNAAAMRDGDLLGRLLETFVIAQLRATAVVSDKRPRLHHLRQEHGHREVDVIVELSGHRVIGIEIKASSAPTTHDARHLMWLREELGDRFVAGVVLHTGSACFPLGEGITAAPISTLWA